MVKIKSTVSLFWRAHDLTVKVGDNSYKGLTTDQRRVLEPYFEGRIMELVEDKPERAAGDDPRGPFAGLVPTVEEYVAAGYKADTYAMAMVRHVTELAMKQFGVSPDDGADSNDEATGSQQAQTAPAESGSGTAAAEPAPSAPAPDATTEPAPAASPAEPAQPATSPAPAAPAASERKRGR